MKEPEKMTNKELAKEIVDIMIKVDEEAYRLAKKLHGIDDVTPMTVLGITRLAWDAGIGMGKTPEQIVAIIQQQLSIYKLVATEFKPLTPILGTRLSPSELVH